MIVDLGVLFQYRFELLEGLQNTLLLVAYAGLTSIVGGLIACFGKLQRRGPLYWLSTFFINTFRTLPETVLIFWLYFCGPIIFKSAPGAWTTGVLAMSLIGAAYFAEIARAGIQSVPVGQWEAARALGLPPVWIWLDVIVPQAIRTMLPASALLVTQLVKMSGLVSIIGVGELIYQAQTLGSLNFRYFEFFTAVAVIYFLLIFPFSMASRYAESRVRRQLGFR